ncbi:hypothetical protein C8R44DRAFT_880951 [Mycena epipterygia]|nr:hypothetical protein C8R44DRAFT_880951 [Mycena epipterygia]
MENYNGTIGSVASTVLKKRLKPTTTNQLVAVDEIGHVAAAARYRVRLIEFAHQSTISPNPYGSMSARKSATRIAGIKRVDQAGISGVYPEVVEQTAAARRADPEMKTFEA